MTNRGKITTMNGAGINTGLVDQTDKMHTGLIKALEAFDKGDKCIGHAGFTIDHTGTYTRFNLAQPIHFTSNNQYSVYGSSINVAYSSDVQHDTYTRYDLVSLVPNLGSNPSLVITQGTLVGANALVGEIPAGNIPIALIEITAGSDNTKTNYNFQLYTFDTRKNSLSLGYETGGYYAETAKIVSSSGGTVLTNSIGDFTIDNTDTNDQIIMQLGSDNSDTAFQVKDNNGDVNFSVDGAGTVTATGFTIGSASISETELEIIDGATLTTTELNYVDGVTSAIQTQLDSKQATITGSASTIDTESLTASRAVISNGSQKIAVSATTSIELGYVNGLTSAVQTQLDAKVKQGLHTIWVPSSAMTPITTAGCSDLTLVEMTAGRPELQVLDFAADAPDYAQFTVAFPKSWNEGTVTFQPFWTVTGTDGGGVNWTLTGISIADDAIINSAYLNVATQASKAHSGTSNDLNVSVESGALTITNAAVDTVTYFKIARNTADGGDDQTGVARLIGIKMFYTTDAENDA